MLLLLFNQASASQTLAPSLFVNLNVFYSPTIANQLQILLPQLFANVSVFFAPEISNLRAPTVWTVATISAEAWTGEGGPVTGWTPATKQDETWAAA